MKILIVKLSSLGDVIQTLPVLHDIRTVFPDAQIDWVVEEAFADLLRQVPGLGRVLPCGQRRWRKTPWAADTRRQWRAFWAQLQERAYDAVIDFQGLVKSARVARGACLETGGFSVTFGNRSELCGYEWPVRWMLKRTVPMERRIHAVARYRMLSARALGYEAHPMLQEAPVYPFARSRPDVSAARGGRVFFAHGTTRQDNEWSLESWQALGTRCLDAGLQVCLPEVNERERALVAQLHQRLGSGVELLPRGSLADMLQVMGQCRGVIGVDSGLSHLAVALDLPTVQIFSQPRAWRAGPVGQPHQCAVGGDHVPSVLEVWTAWERSLAQIPVRAG